MPNLRRLAESVSAGKQDDDAGGDDALTLVMAGDEHAHLEELLKNIDTKRIKPPTDPVEFQFFIYRPESLAHQQFNSRTGDVYRIIDVGPPIIELGFKPARGAPEPTSFDRDLAAGSGHVAIGIIDDGIAFAHERFRTSKGKSRFKALWLQDVERPMPNKAVAFGQRMDNHEINGWLKGKSETEVYRSLGLLDFKKMGSKPLASRRSHGTHVLDLASGFDAAPGKDPEKDKRYLLAVQLPPAVTGDTSGVTMGSYVLQAVRQIMLWADGISLKLPLVINFSYGIQAGPKNGTHPIERALSQLIDSRNRRGAPTCLVLSAGNSYRVRATARMTLEGGASDSLDWIVLPDDGTPNHLEIWLDGDGGAAPPSSVGVNLASPMGEADMVQELVDGEAGMLEVDNQPIAGVYYNIMQNPESPARGRIHIAVNGTAARLQNAHPAPAGRWRLTITNPSRSRVRAHFYIQRDDNPMGYPQRGRQSHFDHPKAYDRIALDGSYRGLNPGCPITSEDTLSAIATGDGSIVVGAAALEGLLPADYSSSGPAMTRVGPDCSAVADQGAAHWGVLAAGTYSGSVVALRGTSVAAPQLVRRIADYLDTQSSGPVLLAAVADGASAAGGSTKDAALQSIAGDTTLAVPASDLRRLGSFVLRQHVTSHIPKRKY